MRLRRSVQLGFAIFLVLLVYYSATIFSSTIGPDAGIGGPRSEYSGNAYVIFLSSDIVDEAGETDVEDDTYFTAARILIYQLLYAPETRTQRNYDVVVATTPSVSAAKRNQLRQDGARVVGIEYVDPGWVQTNRTAWKSVMMKFRLWEMTEYDLIMLLDADIVLQDCMDEAFDGPAVQIRQSVHPPSYTPLSREAPIPSQYVFSATARLNVNGFKYPPESKEDFMDGGEALNAGFIVLRPDKQMFQYYTSLTAVDRFLPDGKQLFERIYSEQALLNYAHRRDGPMPWAELDPIWMLLVPRLQDVLYGHPKALHQKFWKPLASNLAPFLLPWKGRMEGFWEGRSYAR